MGRIRKDRGWHGAHLGKLSQSTRVDPVGFREVSHCLCEVAGLPGIHDSNCVAGALQRTTSRHLVASCGFQYHKINLAFSKGGEQLFVACWRVGIGRDASCNSEGTSRVAFATSIPTAIFSDMVPPDPILVNANLNSSNCSGLSKNGSGHAPNAH